MVRLLFRPSLMFCVLVVFATLLLQGCENAPLAPVSADPGGQDLLLKGSCRSGGSYSSRSRSRSKSGYGSKSSSGKQNDRSWKSKTKSAGKGWCDRYRSKSGSRNCDTGSAGNVPEYDGCVESVDYWRCNPDVWPPPYKADLQFCTVTGATFYAIFTMDATGNWYLILAHEYIGSLLNKTYNAGEIPPEIQEAINQAQLFFHNRDGRVPLTAEETSQAQALADVLSDFNSGNFGLTQCAD